MGTDKPLISILMAVYEPRMDWLREQLESLNAQTYPNLRLYVRDDCSPTVLFGDIERLVKDCITAFPWSIARNEENLGSNKTFERLTEEAEGAFFAYCDQDDVWMPEKLSVMEEQIGSAGLICSDVIPIDVNGKKLADSITKLRPRHVFLQGSNLSGSLIYRNFVIGCAMMIRSEIAKEAVPFVESMVHDHFLALHCTIYHEIVMCSIPTIWYRIHAENQSLVLARVLTKNDYITYRLRPFCVRIDELCSRYHFSKLEDARVWADARQANAARETGAIRRLWSLRSFDLPTTLFEIIALRFPEPVFRLAVNVIRSGRI